MNIITFFLVPDKQQQFLTSGLSMIYKAVGTGAAGGPITPPPPGKKQNLILQLVLDYYLPSLLQIFRPFLVPRCQSPSNFHELKNSSISCQDFREGKKKIFPYFTIS